MIKNILVNLGTAGKRDPAAAFAIDFARQFEAHLTGVAFAYEPVIAATPLDVPTLDFIDAQRAEMEERARAAKQAFERAAGQAGLGLDASVFSLGAASAAEQFGAMARAFDLSVVPQPDPDGGLADELVFEAALFQSGRPTLVVPYVHSGPVRLERALVCWDDGHRAARAIGDALPLLRRTKRTELLTVAGEEGKRDVIPGADIGHHLARHGIDVEVRRIVADGGIGEAILSHAADSEADFLVMGGYGHSRLRQFILGGVTRGMLASMTLPCLMAH